MERTIVKKGSKLVDKICIVCGETIGWDGDPNPACYRHSYGQVVKAIEEKKQKRRKTSAKRSVT